jgi:hypothetical protein
MAKKNKNKKPPLCLRKIHSNRNRGRGGGLAVFVKNMETPFVLRTGKQLVESGLSYMDFQAMDTPPEASLMNDIYVSLAIAVSTIDLAAINVWTWKGNT